MRSTLKPNRLLSLLRTPAEALTAMDLSDLALLGDAAPWLLRDEVLRCLQAEVPRFERLSLPYRPELPDQVGACCIIYATEEYPALRPAFLVALQWREGGSHDHGLPAKLWGLANRVLRQVNQMGLWTLHRLSPYDTLDLAAFDEFLEHESGWAPLAGGLLVLTRGGRPRPDVWATGSWDGNGGVMRVGGLEAKLDLARRWNATEFFLPESQADPKCAGLKLRALRSGLRAPADALSDYLTTLHAEPDMPRLGNDEDFLRCVEYYKLLPNRDERRIPFYFSHLLPTLAERHRETIRDSWPDCKPDYHVTVVSDSPDVVVLNALVSGARHCLLLRSNPEEETVDGGRPPARPTKALIERLKMEGIDCMLGPFDIGRHADLLRQFRAHLDAFLPSELDHARVLYDLTPGKKTMTLALAEVAQPGSWLMYLGHDFNHLDRRAEAGTENYQLWKAGP